MAIVPALEIGGTHVAGALIDLAGPRVVPGSRTRLPLDADGSADTIVEAIAAAAQALTAPLGATWGIAIPGPFDYAAGIGQFEGVAKFGSIKGVDLGRRLLDRLPGAARIVFVNDAEAFLIGEWAAGAALGRDRVAGITLGTGIGSAFLADGRIVDSGPDVPPAGEVHLLTIAGRPLEDTVSRRAILAAYARLRGDATTDATLDVAGIAELARTGDPFAAAAVREPMQALGRALRPWLERFGASALVVGGSMAGSWDLVEPALRGGLGVGVVVLQARAPDDAGLIGAAIHARRLDGDPMASHTTRHTDLDHGH